MKMAVFYNHIIEAAKQNKLLVTYVLSIAKSYGIDYIELDYEEIKNPKVMYSLLKEAGMRVSSIYRIYDFGECPDGTIGYDQIEMAVTMHTDKIMVIPGFLKGPSEKGWGIQRENMLSAMNQMCQYSNDKGVTVTIEDFDDVISPISTAEQMMWFTERIPSLKITFDTGNFMYSSKSELDAFELLKDKIVHVHCKDRTIISNGEEYKLAVDGRAMYPAAVGSGCIKISEIISALNKDGYAGIFVIEHFDVKDHLKYIEQSAKWLISEHSVLKEL